MSKQNKQSYNKLLNSVKFKFKKTKISKAKNSRTHKKQSNQTKVQQSKRINNQIKYLKKTILMK